LEWIIEIKKYYHLEQPSAMVHGPSSIVYFSVVDGRTLPIVVNFLIRLLDKPSRAATFSRLTPGEGEPSFQIQ
jgi:hypothetical protein